MINDLHFRIVAMTAVSVAGGVPVTFVSIVSVRCRGTASVGLMYFYSIFSIYISIYNIYSIKQIKFTVSAVSQQSLCEKCIRTDDRTSMVRDGYCVKYLWGAASDES